MVNPHGVSTTAFFQYGPTESYGNALLLPAASGNTDQIVTAVLKGLNPNTLYHYRISAVSSAGTSAGADATFITSSLSANADLTSLLTNGAVMSPAFSPDVTEYQVTAPASLTGISITPTAADRSASMTINSLPIVSGSSSPTVALPTGATVLLDVTVTAESGAVKTYRLTVNRPLSSDSGLRTLTFSQGGLSPAFTPATTAYTAAVPTTTQVATFLATAHRYATITINGNIAATGSGSMSLLHGVNTATVTVTSEDGSTTTTYTIRVTRPAPAPEIAVENAAGTELHDGDPLSFGDVGSGGGERSLLLLIWNRGTADLTGLNATVEGSGANQFHLSAMAVSAAPSTQIGLVIRYAPTGIGTQSATLRIFSDDADESPFDLLLTGTGVRAQAVPVRTLPATVNNPYTALINGSAGPQAEGAEFWFDHGLTPALGMSEMGWGQGVDEKGQILISTDLPMTSHARHYYRLRVTGPLGTSVGATLSFATPNQDPEAQADFVALTPGAVANLNVLENDSDPDGDTLRVVSATSLPATQGKLTLIPGGLLFAAAQTFTGASFHYSMTDGHGGRQTAQVTLVPAEGSIEPPAMDLVSAGGTYDVSVTFQGAWSVTGLPAWTRAEPTSAGGPATLRITVAGNAGRTTRTATIKIGNQPHVITQAGVLPPDIALPEPVPAGIVGGDFEMAIPTVNGPVTYLVTTGRYAAYGGLMKLPPGLTFDQTTGVLRGRPTKAGTYPLIITARNAAGVAPTTLAFDLMVAPLPAGVAGTFHGYIPGHAGINGWRGSRLEMTITATGAVSGRVITGSSAAPFRGAMMIDAADAGQAQCRFSLPRPGAAPLSLELILDAATNALAGSVREETTGERVDVTGWRQTWGSGRPVTGYEALHAFRLTPPAEADGLPQGHGFGTAGITAENGAVKVSGKLPDGSSFVSATFLGPEGQVLVYQPLYGQAGSFGGVLNLSAASMTGALSWYQPPGASAASARLARAGFGLAAYGVSGGPYPPLLPGGVVMGLPNQGDNARLAFALGGLEAENREFAIGFSVLNPRPDGLTNKFTLPAGDNPNRVTLSTLGMVDGAFGGHFVLPGGSGLPARRIAFEGQIVWEGDTARGWGFFLLPEPPDAPGETVNTTPRHSGQVSLESAAPPAP